MTRTPAPEDVFETDNVKDLALTIKTCVPHDRPARVILKREGRTPLIWDFDYKNTWPVGGAAKQIPHRSSKPVHLAIDDRLAKIAKAILAAPKELFS